MIRVRLKKKETLITLLLLGAVLLLYVLFTLKPKYAEQIYSLGEELSFMSANPTANRYMISGFSGNEEGFTWTDGDEAEMAFRFESSPNDLLVSINIGGIYYMSQHVIASIGGIIVYDQVISATQIIEFNVP